MYIKDDNEIKYYINITYNILSVRKLRERIKNKEYKRLDDKTKFKLVNKEILQIEDLVKSPILIKNKFNDEKISERML